MQIITSKNKTENTIKKFRLILSKLDASNKRNRLEWSFPCKNNNESYKTYTLKTDYGDLYVGTGKWDTRTPFLFRFKNSDSLSSDVEINIPKEINKRISGVFCEEGKSIFLCSRGHFNAYRKRIEKIYVYDHFSKWLVNTDNGQLIFVCSLNSKSIANDLACFVREVISLKGKYKSKNETVKKSDNVWNSGYEFEGKKSFISKAAAVEYKYSHGPICNRLKDYLSKLDIKGLSIFNNKHIDLALINPKTKKANYIFEIKTASLPSDQIYSAVGQLLYYKYLYGTSNTKLFVTLPNDCKSTETEKYLNGIGIKTIYAKGKKFFFNNKIALSIK